MVKELGTLPTGTTDISLLSFGSTSRLHQKLGVMTVDIETITQESGLKLDHQRQWFHSSGGLSFMPYLLSQSAASALLQMSPTVVSGEPSLKNLWSVKSIGTTAHKTTADLSFLHAYQQSLIPRTSEGVSVARFPWKTLLTFQFQNL